MTKIRLLVSFTTLLVVAIFGTLIFLYAQGYRLNPKNGKISSNGILIIKSDPDGSEIYIDGELKTVTNATISLVPKTYDVVVHKEGYKDWSKRLVIEKGVVTEATGQLFKSAPSLSAITSDGVLKMFASDDLSKIAFVVPPSSNEIPSSKSSQGLWLIEMINLPIGFSRAPKRITDADLSNADFLWSPDEREIMATTDKGVYLLNISQFTAQKDIVNITLKKKDTLDKWQKINIEKTSSQLNILPDELQSILKRKASSIEFSPDEDMLMYTASGSATIPDNLIKPLPGSSTQKQERNIKKDNTYVYDIKEDRNFLIDSGPDVPVIKTGFTTDAVRRITWFPTARNIIISEPGKITVMDYDGTNKQDVYSGSYVVPNVYPNLSHDRLLILTNLGADSSLPNLYSLGIK